MNTLLEKRASIININKNGRTSLHLVAWNRRDELIRILFQKGADITVPNNHEQTPLNSAANKGDLEAIKGLFGKKKPYLTVPNNYGWTPLNRAANNGYLKVVKVLGKGADVTVPNKDGWTPLNSAASERTFGPGQVSCAAPYNQPQFNRQ